MPVKGVIGLMFQLRVGFGGFCLKPVSSTSYVALQERTVNVRDHQGVGRTQLQKQNLQDTEDI